MGPREAARPARPQPQRLSTAAARPAAVLPTQTPLPALQGLASGGYASTAPGDARMRQRPVRCGARDLTTSDGSAPLPALPPATRGRWHRMPLPAANRACWQHRLAHQRSRHTCKARRTACMPHRWRRRRQRKHPCAGVPRDRDLQWPPGGRGRWRSPQPRIPGASRLDWRCDDAGTAPDHTRRAMGPHGITAARDGLQAAAAQARDARSRSASAGAKRKAQPMKAGLYRWGGLYRKWSASG